MGENRPPAPPNIRPTRVLFDDAPTVPRPGGAAVPRRFDPRDADTFVYKSISEETRRAYRRAIKDFFSFVRGTRPQEVTRQDVISYRDHLISEKKSARTVNLSCQSYAASSSTSSPTASLPQPRIEQLVAKPPTP